MAMSTGTSNPGSSNHLLLPPLAGLLAAKLPYGIAENNFAYVTLASAIPDPDNLDTSLRRMNFREFQFPCNKT